jgi:hypothetical protein
MPPGGSVAVAAEPASRCTRCGTAVTGTRHTRSGYTVGHFTLHTGRTVEASFRRRDDEAPIAYRRLVDAVEVVSCPTCFALPEVRELWDRFGDEEGSTT